MQISMLLHLGVFIISLYIHHVPSVASSTAAVARVLFLSHPKRKKKEVNDERGRGKSKRVESVKDGRGPDSQQ